jgi:hypothetical protein
MLIFGLAVSHLRAATRSFLLSPARRMSVSLAVPFRPRSGPFVVAARADARSWHRHGRVAPLKTRTPRTT